MASKKDEASDDLGRTTGEATQQAAGFVRRTAEQTAGIADRELRQAAEMMRQGGQDVSKLLALPTLAYQDLAEHSQADFGALVQSSARLARGIQEMGWEASQLTQESVRLGMQLANDLLECRSVEDLVNRQRDFLKESVEVVLSGSARLLTLSSRVANDAASPINQRIGVEGEQAGHHSGGESRQ